MFSWKPEFKLAGKIFAILRKRPNISGKQNGHFKANGLAGHDHSGIPQSLTLDSAPTPGHDDDPRLYASSSLGVRTSSPYDSVHANVHPSGSFFTGARNLTLNGGEFYNVGGNLTIQRTDPREIVEMAVACAMEVHAQMNDRRLEEMMGHSQPLPRTISMGLVYIMDATGRQHELTMNMARSLEQFNRALRVLFVPDTPQDKILHKYMDIGAYLTIDDGKKQLQLTHQEEWSSAVLRGTTIVMSIVMVQHICDSKKYKCPFCEFWNMLEEDYGQSSINCDVFRFQQIT